MSKKETKVIKQLRGGQITMPVQVRKQLGITEETLLQMTLEGQELRIRPLRVAQTAQGSPWLKELHSLFAPTREEAEQYDEEEINTASYQHSQRVLRRQGW